MKGAEMYSGSFVTQFESTVVAEPRQRAFDNIPCFAQSAAMRTATRRQQTGDHHADDQLDGPDKAISTVALQGLWLGAFLAAFITHVRKLF